jgi:hypothetical protein
MGQTIERSCDYDGCPETESLTCDPDGYVRESGDDGQWMSHVPAQVVGNILWRSYEREQYPNGRYLCREHERQVRTALGIHLVAGAAGR